MAMGDPMSEAMYHEGHEIQLNTPNINFFNSLHPHQDFLNHTTTGICIFDSSGEV